METRQQADKADKARLYLEAAERGLARSLLPPTAEFSPLPKRRKLRKAGNPIDR